MRYFKINKQNWICGVSDGLISPCSICNKKVDWDYGVTDELWEHIVPDSLKRSVICLPCLDELATKVDKIVGDYIEFVQFTGRLHTIEFFPANVFIIK